MKAVVSIVGRDQVGIIAMVCNHLAEHNVNVLDIRQSVLQGYFTMTMVVDMSGCDMTLIQLSELMEAAGSKMGLSIRVLREDIFQAMHRI